MIFLEWFFLNFGKKWIFSPSFPESVFVSLSQNHLSWLLHCHHFSKCAASDECAHCQPSTRGAKEMGHKENHNRNSLQQLLDQIPAEVRTTITQRSPDMQPIMARMYLKSIENEAKEADAQIGDAAPKKMIQTPPPLKPSTAPELLRDHLEPIRKTFTTKCLVQVTLPHNKSTESIYIRKNGKMTIKIVADDAGLPYGTYARLILIWIMSEVIHNKSPFINLGKMSDFLRKIETKNTGGRKGTIAQIKDQMRRLFSSTLMVRYDDGEKEAGKNVNIASEYLLWNNDRKESMVEIDAKFFSELMVHPIPIDFTIVQRLRRSSLALDIYCWLSYRLSYLRKETMVTWNQLSEQFGSEYANIRHFRAKFKAALDKMSDLFPESRVRPGTRGVLLLPARVKKPSQVNNTDSMTSNQNGQQARLGTGFELDAKTRRAAKEIAPHLDIDYLFQQWVEWVAKSGRAPHSPRNAFLGFIRKKLINSTT